MDKIVPVLMLVVAIVGAFLSLVGMCLAFAAFAFSAASVAAVIFLFLSCVFCTVGSVQGIIFKSKICKAALIISIIGVAMTFIGFVTLYSV